MDKPIAQQWELAQQVEKDLQAQLKKDAPLFDDIEHLIKQIRITCETIIFLDFEYATSQGVESHLWDSHSIINKRYRKLVSHYRSKNLKRHVVEKRKLEKRYADFIKMSQFFYKGYIQRLASHFSAMKGLRRVAARLSLSPLTVDERVKVSPKVEQLIELSCHATLLRLGDLARYRNELRTKDRSWDSALAFYGLAGELCPDSGSSHNQMAVIALSDQNHFEALYQLYRAIAVKEPHPLARGNLEIEFKKVTTAWDKGMQAKMDPEATLIQWFVRLHVKFFRGAEFSTHEELENEVLYRLALLLKNKDLEVTLQKFILINISAEYLAGERVKEEGANVTQEIVQSYYFFLRLNVRVLMVLIQTVSPELEKSSMEADSKSAKAEQDLSGMITATTSRILPALRQYSTWLIANSPIIIASQGEAAIGVHIKEMWNMYANTLTRLLNFFPVEELPAIPYLLPEDEFTLGFKPFRDPNLAPSCTLYIDQNLAMKPRFTDPGVERSDSYLEMLGRVRDVLICGLELHENPKYPIIYDAPSKAFNYFEEDPAVASPTSYQGAIPSGNLPHKSNAKNSPETPKYSKKVANQDAGVIVPDSQQSMDTEMCQMVDNLLEPTRANTSNESSYGLHSNTANDIFLSTHLNGIHQGTPKVIPSLPDFLSSPFAPQPNELQPTSPERPTTARKPFSPAGVATSPENLIDYPGRKRDSWKRTSGHESETPLRPVVQELAESLTQQFNLGPASSAFTNSSSVYANTPVGRYKYGETKGMGYSTPHGDNPTTYPGASLFDKTTMLQSSLYNGSQPAWVGSVKTPPGGQGGA